MSWESEGTEADYLQDHCDFYDNDDWDYDEEAANLAQR